MSLLVPVRNRSSPASVVVVGLYGIDGRLSNAEGSHSRDDLQAIYAYLQVIPPVVQEVAIGR
jgi:hypothetical protein